MEKSIEESYLDDKALMSVLAEIRKYLAEVRTQVDDLFNAYSNASDEEERAEAKRAYVEALREKTINNSEYRKLIQKYANALTKANQKAVEIANRTMSSIYMENYNAVAEDCRKAGIKVDG